MCTMVNWTTLITYNICSCTSAKVWKILPTRIGKIHQWILSFSWQDFPDISRSTGAYIICYQGGPIDHITHVLGPVAQSSSESEYNAACTAGMALAHFRMLIHKWLNKDTYIVPEEAPPIILDSKSSVCMAKNGKDTKHIRHISRRIHFVRDG